MMEEKYAKAIFEGLKDHLSEKLDVHTEVDKDMLGDYCIFIYRKEKDYGNNIVHSNLIGALKFSDGKLEDTKPEQFSFHSGESFSVAIEDAGFLYKIEDFIRKVSLGMKL